MPTFDSQVKFQKIPVSQLVVEQAAAASAPASPIVGQLWFDTTNSQLKVCTNATGPVWVQCDNVTGGTASNVTDGDKGDITIASGVWTIDTGAVTSGKILDGTIALGDLAFTPIVSGGAAGGDLTGTYPNPTLSSATVQAVKPNVQDEGSNVALDIAVLNFKGAGVVAAQESLGTAGITIDGSPQGAAGGSLTNTYPNPSIALNAVGYSELGSSVKPVSGFAADSAEALRALGYTAKLAMPGVARLDQISAPTSSVSLNGQKLTLVSDPTNPTDGVNKLYVDSVAQGLDAKQSVRGASQGQMTLSGQGGTYNPPDGFGGIMPTTGDRVLAKNQTNPAENGIYIVAAGAWTRATDLNDWLEVPGAYVFVEDGFLMDTGWVCTANQGGTIGSTAMPWTQFSGAGQYTGGNGLTLNGTDLYVNVDGSTIEISGDALRVKTQGITNTQLADNSVTINTLNVGAVTLSKMNSNTIDQAAGTSSMRSLGTGATQAAAGNHGHALTDAGITGILSTAKGGTGSDASTIPGQLTARQGLGAMGSYATLSPALTAGTWATITHNTGARARHVSFEEVSSGEARVLDWRVNPVNALTQVDIRCDVVGGRAASYYNVNVAV